MDESRGLPSKGTPREEVLAQLRAAREGDADWRGGRTWSLVYFAGEEIEHLLKEAYATFFSENALSPLAFQSLRRFEAEVLRMAAGLFGGGEGVAGSMTSGGSESVLMAVKTARDWGRARGVRAPKMIVPVTVHPAFMKAAHYFDVEPVVIGVRDDFRADVEAARRACDERTVLLVGSAVAYPHGVVDPITELAALAQERGILCHVDACLGGFLLPFARRLGRAIPDFDFRVPGVTSLSADIHKYGFAAKGASVVLYRDKALRRHQFFTYAGWPGGLYGSPTMTGTRPGGAIAAAWAILKHLGEEGYLRIARGILETTDKLIAGIERIPGLRVLGKPDMSVFAFGSDTLNVYELADAMDARGWHMDRQQLPPALHLMVTPAHAASADRFLDDLASCARSLAAGEPAPPGSAAMYGMIGAAPDRSVVGDFILQFMDDTLYPS